VPIQRSSSSLSRRTGIEVPVAFPHECRVRPSGPVRVPQRFRELERVRARRDHQRWEGVPQIMELEPLVIRTRCGSLPMLETTPRHESFALGSRARR